MQTVVVSGVAGSIGEKISKHLQATGEWMLRLLDRHSRPRSEIIGADLSTPDQTWTEQFCGVDAVIHLAGDPYPTGDWDLVTRLKVDLSLNVLSAVRRHRCPKLIFARSNWVMAGYRFTEDRLRTDLPPRPTNAYGCASYLSSALGLISRARPAPPSLHFASDIANTNPATSPTPT